MGTTTTVSDPPRTGAASRHRSLGWLVAAALVAVAAVAGYYLWRRHARDTAAAAAAALSAANRPVPVVTSPVAARDLPIWLDGLGNVLAFKTVTVHPRVDGQLQAVFFTEGQFVHTGDALAQIDPRPYQAALHQYEGALARDQAQLRDAAINKERYRQLVAEKLVAQQQLDDQTALAGQAEGATKMDAAQIEAAKLNLTYARITSPIDGVTGVRLVDPGNVVHASDTNGIVVITQLDPIAVTFTLPEDNLPAVAQAQKAGPLAVEAWSRDGKIRLGTGTLVVIDNQINAATGTILLKARFDNKERALWPNQFVKARLKLATRPNALVVPSPAVQRGPDGNFVYVVKAGNVAEARPVTIELTQGDLSVASKGLAAGEAVVVDGQSQLRPGSKVAPKAAAAASAAPPSATSGGSSP